MCTKCKYGGVCDAGPTAMAEKREFLAKYLQMVKCV